MRSEPRELSVEAGYERWAHTYDDGLNPLLPAEEAVVEPLLRTIGYDSVLDVGAGTGRYSLMAIADASRVVAVDPSPEMLAHLTRKPGAERIEVLPGGLDDAPWQPQRFDLVICALVLCHIPDLEAALGTLADAVTPGGHLLVTDFHPAAVEAGLRTEFREGDHRYLLPNPAHTREDYTAALTERAFTILEGIDIPMGACWPELPPDEFLEPGPGRLTAEYRETWSELPFSFVLLARAAR